MINHCWRPFWSAKSDAGRANKRTCQTAFARALQDIFETSDRDIKKERATSCPAGGHWRGINHPCEGLHFNARGWISNARAQAARSRARQPALGSRRCIRCNRPAVLCSARAYSVRCQRLSETLRYRCSGRRIRRARVVDAGRRQQQRKSLSSLSPLFRDWRNSPLFLFYSLLFFIPLWCMSPDFTAINLLAGCVQSIFFSVDWSTLYYNKKCLMISFSNWSLTFKNNVL